jgi:hypothetical protein
MVKNSVNTIIIKMKMHCKNIIVCNISCWFEEYIRIFKTKLLFSFKILCYVGSRQIFRVIGLQFPSNGYQQCDFEVGTVDINTSEPKLCNENSAVPWYYVVCKYSKEKNILQINWVAFVCISYNIYCSISYITSVQLLLHLYSFVKLILECGLFIRLIFINIGSTAKLINIWVFYFM